MYRAIALVLAFALLPLASAVSVASTERLTEKSIRTPSASNDEGPERISGYFKLDRTKDAHMFYFLFQSRSMKPDDPVVLWMTGAIHICFCARLHHTVFATHCYCVQIGHRVWRINRH